MQDTPRPPIEKLPDGSAIVAQVADAKPGGAARLRAKLADLALPTKLLVITLLFVMLAEILVFVPSIASYRLNWLQSRIASARLASMAADASATGRVPAMVRRELLRTAEVRAVAIKMDDVRLLVLPSDTPLVIDQTFDLRGVNIDGFWDKIGTIPDALHVFIGRRDRMIAVYGQVQAEKAAETGKNTFVEVVLPEAQLRADMIEHGLNVLGLSIIISIIAAAAVYLTLIKVLVRPMMRITDNMVHFGENPEDTSRIMVPGQRRDEIGVAEKELASMQTQLNQLLNQRKRLADLGLAVSKINHDLRNMLASAQLISDRLAELPDPSVQRFAPKLIASLDRAINFCNDTLRFGRAQEEAPRRELFVLAPLVDEIADGLGLPHELIAWQVNIAPTLQIDADRDHLYRVLNNIVRNAVQVIEAQAKATDGLISVSAEREGRTTIIQVSDNGPGVPARARENMFQAFKGGARKGGTGLGLAISAELIRAHGGDISRLDNDAAGATETAGATFRIVIPDRKTRATT